MVITATKTGQRKERHVFRALLVEALRDPAADADKNEADLRARGVSIRRSEDGEIFETENRLATEHALIEDTGKGEGVKDPSAENGEGLIAGRFNLMHLGSVAAVANDPAKQKLLKHKEDLNAPVDELKYRKASKGSRGPISQAVARILIDLAKRRRSWTNERQRKPPQYRFCASRLPCRRFFTGCFAGAKLRRRHIASAQIVSATPATAAEPPE